jgi:hypothetical protein
MGRQRALFLVDQKYLAMLDKSELNYLFASLDMLLLCDLSQSNSAVTLNAATATEPLKQLGNVFTHNPRYILRYTFASMQ